MKLKTQGFTLIESLITIAIIAISAAIAYPTYSEHINKSKRREAEAALLSLANAMETYRMQNNNSYLGATVGGTGIFTNQVPVSGGTKTYTLAISALGTSTYTLSATPVKSDKCGTLTLTNVGVKSPLTDDCW